MKRPNGTSKGRQNNTGKSSTSTPRPSRAGGSRLVVIVKSPATPRSGKSGPSSRSKNRTEATSTLSPKPSPGSTTKTKRPRGSRRPSGTRPSGTTPLHEPTAPPTELNAQHAAALATVDVTDKVSILPFSSDQENCWLLVPACGDASLLVRWVVDHNRYGRYFIHLVGYDAGQIIMKQLRPGHDVPAFAGDVAVKGSGRNDLYCSYGYEDPDQQDPDGTVVNKPQSIVISPRRED